MDKAEQHDNRWRAIRSSQLADLYLGEAKALVNSCLKSSRMLRELAPSDLGNAIKVSEEILSQAHILVSSAGRLRNLLFAAERSRNESEKRYELRIRRARWLREEVFADIDVSILDDRGVRNSIEHFDDRLDEVAEKAADGVFEFPLFVVSDVALGHDNVMAFLQETSRPPKTVRYIRTYLADQGTFHVLRWSFKVEMVAVCCEKMLERLGSGWIDARTLSDHVGSITIQGDRPKPDGESV